MPSVRSLTSAVLIVLALPVTDGAGASDDAHSAWRFPRLAAVKCGERDCGTMVISRYHYFRDGDPTPAYERKGAVIRGRFRPVEGSAIEFHYLQVLTYFKGDDFRWVRDPTVPLPVRYVDPPPFGTRQLASNPRGGFREVDQAFDALPWFDEGGLSRLRGLAARVPRERPAARRGLDALRNLARLRHRQPPRS
jgi:hypothetical protein